MSTLHQVREGLNEAWYPLVDDWQRLCRRALGAITRFTPGKKAREDEKGAGQEIAVRSAGWGGTGRGGLRRTPDRGRSRGPRPGKVGFRSGGARQLTGRAR